MDNSFTKNVLEFGNPPLAAVFFIFFVVLFSRIDIWFCKYIDRRIVAALLMIWVVVNFFLLSHQL
jgi:hypothetical protein